MHVDRFLEEEAEVEEGKGEAARAVAEQGRLGAEFDLAPFLVIDLLHHLGRRARRRRIRPIGEFARPGLEEVVGEGLGLVIGQRLARIGGSLRD